MSLNRKRLVREQDKSDVVKGAKKKGYFGTAGAYVSLFAYRFMTIQGFFYKGFNVGIGAGLGYGETWYWDEYNDDSYYMDLSVPVFLHISQELMRTEVSPYIEVDFGYDLILCNPL